MIFIRTDILNPYEREIISNDSYDSLIEFLQDKYPNGFDNPTDISINGNIIEIDDYDIELNDSDIIVLLDRTALPVGLVGGWLITALANLAISVTLSYVANKLFAPDAPGEQAAPSSVYAINNAQNSARFGSPIPIIYGKVRAYPSMIVQPYYKFEDNIEYLYHVLCVGQGTLTANGIMIGDDCVGSTTDVEYTILNQDSFYNIPLNAYGVHLSKTLASPSSVHLSETDFIETERYKIDKEASAVEFDYMYPRGLSYVNGDGDYVTTSATFTFNVYTLADDVYTLVYSQDITDSGANSEPIQKTVSFDASSYDSELYVSFKMKYFYDHSRDTHDLYLKRVKALYPNEDFTNLYGDVTLLACKIKATNAVSSSGQVKVNGYFTRTDVGNTLHEVLTDLYTNTSYGGGLNSDDLSFPVTTETVNCAYDTNMTLFDAMRKPALAQGYSLYLAGMDVILKKDAPNTVTSGMYNEMNIIKNSLKVQYLFKEEYPTYDGFECTYIDGCDWRPKTAKYPATSTRPQRVDLFGVVDYTACVDGCTETPPLYHTFEMVLTATATPIVSSTGGTLNIDYEGTDGLGDGIYRVWSDDSVTRVYITNMPTAYNIIKTAEIFNMGSLTSMQEMFRYCSHMTSCIVNSHDTQNGVTSMERAFDGTVTLTTLDVSNIDTSNVTTMNKTFYNTTAIQSIDLTGWDFSSVTDFDYMFAGASNLGCITNIDTTNTSTKVLMFQYASSLSAPNSTDQTLIASTSGYNWTNPSACP